MKKPATKNTKVARAIPSKGVESKRRKVLPAPPDTTPDAVVPPAPDATSPEPLTPAAPGTPTVALRMAPDATSSPDATMTTIPAGSRDARLPAPGTILEKRDRYGSLQCSCTIEEGGFRYNGHVYRSLSAAALAAAKDLGLQNTTQNGFTFWGLATPVRNTDPLAALGRAWHKYQTTLARLTGSGLPVAQRSTLASTVREQAAHLSRIQESLT